MAVTAKYYQGDVGTEIRLNTWVDLTDATVADILVKKPSGALATWAGDVDTETDAEVAARLLLDPTSSATALDSVISYVVGSGDFDEVGQVRLQASIVTPDGSWRGNTATFSVSPAWAI